MPRLPRWPGHAEIGTFYIVLAIVAGLVGGALSLSLKLPAMLDAGPGMHAAWRAAALQHGPMLLFFSGIPALLGGFGNWFVPLLIGARDTALPRLGAIAFGLTAAGLALILFGLLPGTSPMVLLAAIHLAGAGLLLCAINLIATVLNMRTGGMTLGEMPLFVWAQLLACCLAVVALPMLLAALALIAQPAIVTGRPLPPLRLLALPGIGIMVLTGFGLAAEILADLGGSRFAGRRTMIVAMAALAVGGFLAWAHRLLAGVSASSGALLSPLVLLPMLVMAGCCMVTLASAPRRRLLLRQASGLFAIGFVIVLSLGGTLGSLPSGRGVPQPLHDLPSLGVMFAVFAGFYHWIGRMTGKPHPETLGRMQFWLLAAGVTLTTASSPELAAVGAALTSLSMLLFALIVVVTLTRARSPDASCRIVGGTLPEWRPQPSTDVAGG